MKMHLIPLMISQVNPFAYDSNVVKSFRFLVLYIDFSSGYFILIAIKLHLLLIKNVKM